MLSTLSVASALVALAAAQSASTTVSQSMPPIATAAFNPASVSNSDACELELLPPSDPPRPNKLPFAVNWCRAQLNTCPQICGGAAHPNMCDSVGQHLVQSRLVLLWRKAPCIGFEDIYSLRWRSVLTFVSEHLHLHVYLHKRHRARLHSLPTDPPLLHLPSDLPTVHPRPSK